MERKNFIAGSIACIVCVPVDLDFQKFVVEKHMKKLVQFCNGFAFDLRLAYIKKDIF
jgi:hypothetical protein